MSERNKRDLKRIQTDIGKYGCHIIQVMEDADHPQFSYTIGFYEKFNHPEVIIIGLKNELSKILLNNMAYSGD